MSTYPLDMSCQDTLSQQLSTCPTNHTSYQQPINAFSYSLRNPSTQPILINHPRNPSLANPSPQHPLIIRHVGEDVGLTIEKDIQNFRSMISNHVTLEKQELERTKRQKDGQIENETVDSTNALGTIRVQRQMQGQYQGHNLDQNQTSHPVVSTFSHDVSCDENDCNGIHSVFSLPLELQEYVRRIQREQQILRDSRTTYKT